MASNSLTGEVARRTERPGDGELLAVAPGVNWLRMPLPFVLNHINLWLLEDGDGWCIVDTGIAAKATIAVWENLLDGKLADRPVTRVIATHLHPDHVGMAGWLTERTGAKLLMTRTEYLSARLLAADQPSLGFVGPRSTRSDHRPWGHDPAGHSPVEEDREGRGKHGREVGQVLRHHLGNRARRRLAVGHGCLFNLDLG